VPKGYDYRANVMCMMEGKYAFIKLPLCILCIASMLPKRVYCVPLSNKSGRFYGSTETCRTTTSVEK